MEGQEARETPLEQSDNQQQTQPTYIKYGTSLELNPVHIGGKRALFIIILYLPSDFRVALTGKYVSEHFNNTTAQWAKTRPQHRELRALLFTASVWVL